jgi:RNase H-like domain found in reverse transcriptase
MQEDARFEWTNACAEAFEKLKHYLANPPCLTRPAIGDSLLLYLVVAEHAVSAALVHEEGTQ